MITAPVTMTSLEIAELTGKRHDHVVRDIRTMLVELHGEGCLLSFEQTSARPSPSGDGVIESAIFRMPKHETF